VRKRRRSRRNGGTRYIIGTSSVSEKLNQHPSLSVTVKGSHMAVLLGGSQSTTTNRLRGLDGYSSHRDVGENPLLQLSPYVRTFRAVGSCGGSLGTQARSMAAISATIVREERGKVNSVETVAE